MAATKKTSTRRSTRRIQPTARKKATRRLERTSKNARLTARSGKAHTTKAAGKGPRRARPAARKKTTGLERTWTQAQASLRSDHSGEAFVDCSSELFDLGDGQGNQIRGVDVGLR